MVFSSFRARLASTAAPRDFFSIARSWARSSRAFPAQIAAGHALGYRPDRVKGNIVRCRQALAQADECLGLVTRLPRRFLPTAEYKCLVQDTARMRNALQDWVHLLRDRFTRGGRR